MEEAYFTDPNYLQRLGVDVLPPVPFNDVITWMSKATFNPILLRPTFNRLRLVTPRMFETPAADTLPVFLVDGLHVRELYGDAAGELVLGDDPSAKITDLLNRPGHYRDVVREMREHLRARHSHRARLTELIEIVES